MNGGVLVNILAFFPLFLSKDTPLQCHRAACPVNTNQLRIHPLCPRSEIPCPKSCVEALRMREGYRRVPTFRGGQFSTSRLLRLSGLTEQTENGKPYKYRSQIGLRLDHIINAISFSAALLKGDHLQSFLPKVPRLNSQKGEMGRKVKAYSG